MNDYPFFVRHDHAYPGTQIKEWVDAAVQAERHTCMIERQSAVRAEREACARILDRRADELHHLQDTSFRATSLIYSARSEIIALAAMIRAQGQQDMK